MTAFFVTPMLERGVFLDSESIDNGDLDLSGLDTAVPHWVFHAHSAPDQLASRIRETDLVLVNKCVIDRSCLEQAKRLKLIALCATGTNNIDLEAARDLGITVCNIRDYCSDSLAQHAITLMLNLLTRQPEYLRRVRAGEWSRARQFSLHDEPIRQANELIFGVVGHGALGQATAKLAAALGMRVVVAEHKGRTPRSGREAFETVLREADVISLHCPLTAETEGLFSASEFRAMKNDAVLINTARGGIVDESALVAALKSGEIGGAAVDTLSQEPPPQSHPLLDDSIPNLLLTPHNAWASRTARQAALDQLVEVIRSFREGKPMNVVS